MWLALRLQDSLRLTETTLDLTASFCRLNAHSCTGAFLAQVDTTVALMTEVFSPGVHTQLKGPVGVAGQGFSESSATSGAGPRRRLPAGGTRHFADAGA